MSEIKTKGTVRLFACGGLGANIASLLARHDGQAQEGFANLETCLIDTSRSNLINSDMPEDKIYLIDGLDGSGGRRAENASKILEHRLHVLERFRPSDDLNIVLSSLSGGSGSVIAPLIAEELLKRGHNVIVLSVGSQETVLDCNNTLKTLQSYDKISERVGLPIVTSYIENDKEHGHEANNKAVVARITALRSLFSRENRGLDSMDLTNWLKFQTVTSHTKVRLAGLSITDKNGDLSTAKNIISVATLATDAENASLPMMVEFQRVGYVSPKLKTEQLPLHYLISDGFLAERVARIEKTLNDFDSATAARVPSSKMFSRKAVEDDDTGIVL